MMSDLPKDPMPSDPTSTTNVSDSASNSRPKISSEMDVTIQSEPVAKASTAKQAALDQFEKPVRFMNSNITKESLPKDVEQLWGDLYDIAATAPMSFQPPDTTASMEWDKAKELVELAGSLEKDSAPESNWNFFVHHPTLRTTSDSCAGVWPEVLTTATTHEAFLPKTLGSASEASRKTSKLIDFGISLIPDEDLLARLKDVLDEGSPADTSINPARLKWARCRPIGLPIETKSENPHRGTSEYQLGVDFSMA
ncbi:hypothetical protein CSOJ01_01923 [Colletotrichum sojae]|uniref:PD-(D/E)XK nuclease-like domain-containing protein n=1 Tax=Colletotrichum sojae TaxID=2175907 RepID=A0A8H6N2U1_9PEZI|nr:hypothetical protein CSOJ01_01923 [Colletotrichum sojae]